MNTSRNKDRWDSLSMKEKSDMMKVAVQQGIYNLSDIKKAYNEFAEGGDTEKEYYAGTLPEVEISTPRIDSYIAQPSSTYTAPYISEFPDIRFIGSRYDRDTLTDKGGKPADDISYKERWERQKRERTIEDWKNLGRGFSNTVGTAIDLASLIYGGGWAATRLLKGNRASSIGQKFAKYVLPSNAVDNIGDAADFMIDPSVSKAAELGAGVALGQWRDFGNAYRQASELGSQALNVYNTTSDYTKGKTFAEGGPENNGTPRPITTGGAGYVPSSSSNVQVFNKEKIYNRVLPTEMTGANTGPLDSVKQYLFNNDRAVDEWFENYVPYINNSYGDAIEASRILNDLYGKADAEKEQEFLENSSTMKALMYQKLAPEMFVQEDGKDIYLGMPQRFGTMRDAEYHPANGKLVNGKYVSYMRDPIFVDTEIIPTYQNYIMGITRKDNPDSNVQRVTKNGNALVYMPFLNNATMSKGYDPNRGEYVSIYDDWDYNTAVLGKAGDNISKFIGGQPFSIYDRYYLDDIFDVPKDKRGSYYLPEVTVTPEKKSFGGSLIDIANKFYDGGDGNQPYTPFLNETSETPMQAAIRQLQSPEARAAYWNATHPQTTSETPIVAQPEGTFRRETRNIPLNTSAEAARTALEFTPVIGDVMFAGDVADEARQGNYGTAAALAGLAVLPNVVEKPLKKGLRKLGLFDNAAIAAKATSAEWTAAQDAAIAKALNITPEEAASLTKEQWEAAIARGINVDDVQRMRDLHSGAIAENNVLVYKNGFPVRLKHNTNSKPWTVYDESFFDTGTGDGGWYGKGLYATGNTFGENAYGKNSMYLYGYMKNPAIIPPANTSLDKVPDNFTTGFVARDFFNRGISKEDYIRNLHGDALEWYKEYSELISKAVENVEKADGVIVQREALGSLPFAPFDEVVLPKGTHMKSADAVTFDDNGVRVPLGKRDNFKVNDLRQGLGGPLVNRANQYALGGNMYGWGDFLKGSYNSIKDTASNVVDKAGDALISAANWLHDALKVDSPTPAATTKPYVEQDYTSPAFMPYSYGSTSNYNVDDSSWDETKEVQLPEITITTDKVLKELPVEKLSQNEYLRNEYNKDNSVEEARKLNRKDLKKLQQTLADKGYYDLNTDNMSVDEIKNIQKKIGAKADGIAGKETRKKWRQYNVDGLWGKRTEEAILKGTKKDYWDRDVTTDNTEWCAEWVHKKAVNATGNDNCGVWGDAWRMPQNVVKNGGTEVYNIYNDKAFRGITDVTSLKKATEKALKEHPFDISTLRVGDIVGIYMPSSNMHSTALRDGTTFNTHVGIVTGFDKNGKPVIEHNIHKNHHKDAADNIRGSLVGKARIATVSRPDYGTPQKAFEVESAPSEYTKESDSPLFKQYAESAAGSKELLQNVFPNVDIDEVERIVLAVQGRETGFMKNKRSDQTGISGLKVKAGDYYRDNIMGKNAESVSSNLAKMKLTSFDPNERYMLGLTDPKDLEDPKKAGTAAMYLMAKNYSYFKNLQESYPQLGITDDDIRYLTELSYNQGMSKLRNIGFTSEGAAAPEELEAIRAMADENAKIKDVSATNYRYLGSLGEMLYDAFADGHTPYIAAAEKYRRQLMENADTE